MQDFEDDTPAIVTIVDDDPAVLDVLLRAARMWNYSCRGVTTAEQGLELLERNPTPLLVTDLRMPGRGGIWLVQEVRRRWPRIEITVITAGHDTDAAIDCLNAGAHRYFLKPINLDDFHHALDDTHQRYCNARAKEAERRHLQKQVAKKTRVIQRNFLGSIKMMVSIQEARDSYTSGHSRRVQLYALQLARALNFDRRQVRQVSLAARLHDVGKLGVPESILNKPDRLTVAEFDVIREHPVIGERILSKVIRNREVLAAVRGHHEKMDGSGYPDGLRGPHLPALARVIAIVDAFDALTSSRAYRGAMPTQEALGILADGAGNHFDADYVRAFLTCVAVN